MAARPRSRAAAKRPTALSLPNRDCICIHLKSNLEKFYLLCLMTRKLFAFAKQECMEENPDSITFQEVLTPGQLYLMFLKVTSACLALAARETARALSRWTGSVEL